MGKIIVANTEFEIDAKVVRWFEGPKFDAHKESCTGPGAERCSGPTPYGEKAKNRAANRFRARPALKQYKTDARNIPLAAAQAVIRQFVLHHDGCPNASTCFKVLHNERGLSCHFLLDNDGTLYQTLDLAFMAFHAAGFNANSVGIEMCNRGDAKKWPGYYDGKRQKRETTTVRIHGHIYKAYKFTPAQHDTMRALAKGLQRALPNLPLEYPQDTPGHQAWSEIPNAGRFAGYLGHYHTTRRKWDPGPFDFKDFCESSRGALCFPLFASFKKQEEARGGRPEIPEEPDKLDALAEDFYELNERKGEGGYFPVGPTSGEGESRLWHGGVHLTGKYQSPIFSPFPARLLAVRMGSGSEIGSTNFALLRHDMTIGTGSVRFYSLYFHLDNELKTEPGEPGAPEWLAAKAWQEQKKNNRTVLLNEPIEAGRIIGRMGKAGPPSARQAQIHFEIFANEEITEKIEADTSLLKEKWEIIDGTLGGRFCTNPKVNELIDTNPKDGQLSRSELLSFFRSSADRALTRRFAVLHTSEWIGSPDWLESLELAPEYASLGKARLKSLVEGQITPTLWWTEAVSKHAKLPKDGVVFHYHPLAFVRYINSKLLQAKALEADGVGAFDEAHAKETPSDVTDDLDDESGDSFVDEAELTEEAFDDSLGLEELIKGFPS